MTSSRCVLCAAAIQPGGTHPRCEQAALWLTAYVLWQRPGNEYRERDVAEKLAGYTKRRFESDSILKMLSERDGAAAGELMHAYAPRLLVSDDGAPRGPTAGENDIIYEEVVAVLAGQVLDLDLAAAWRADRESPMRGKFWGLHSKDQLAELGEELGVYVDAKLKKSEAV